MCRMTYCIFCHDITDKQILTQTDSYKVVYDIDLVRARYLLLFSKHHYMNICELPEKALVDLMMLEQRLAVF